MKCPYNIKIEQINQNTYEYNQDSNVEVHSHKLLENRIFTECYKEECGAWQDGKCRYKEFV